MTIGLGLPTLTRLFSGSCHLLILVRVTDTRVAIAVSVAGDSTFEVHRVVQESMEMCLVYLKGGFAPNICLLQCISIGLRCYSVPVS